MNKGRQRPFAAIAQTHFNEAMRLPLCASIIVLSAVACGASPLAR